MTTPTPDLLSTVAANVLRVLDGGDPDHIDNALSDYAWAHVQEEHGIDRFGARWLKRNFPDDQHRIQQARAAIETANAHTDRLRAMDRDKLRAELERVAGVMAEAA